MALKGQRAMLTALTLGFLQRPERRKACFGGLQTLFACGLQTLPLALEFLGLFRLRIVQDCKATPLLVHMENA